MMKKLSTYLLAFLLLFCVASFAHAEEAAPEQSFTLRDGITWSSSLEDVIAALPDEDVDVEEDCDDYLIGISAGLYADNVPVSTTDAEFVCLFYKEQPLMIYYGFDDQQENFALIKDALTLKYGEPTTSNDNKAATRELFISILGQEYSSQIEINDYCCWFYGDDTRIFIAKDSSSFIVGYENLALIELRAAELDEYLAQQEAMKQAADEAAKTFGL